MTNHSPISEVAGGLFSGIVDISGTILIGALILFTVLGLFFYLFFYRRKFDISVKILSERASDPRMFFDKAAVMTDKKGNKYLKLLKAKVELPMPPFKVLESTNRGDYIEIWRKSEDDFVYLTKPHIDKTKMIKADGKLYPIGRTSQRHIEGDMYWMSKRKEENKKLLDPESLLMKLLSWAPQILSSVFLLLILFVFMDKLPELVNQLVELTKELRALKGSTIPA